MLHRGNFKAGLNHKNSVPKKEGNPRGENQPKTKETRKGQGTTTATHPRTTFHAIFFYFILILRYLRSVKSSSTEERSWTRAETWPRTNEPKITLWLGPPQASFVPLPTESCVSREAASKPPPFFQTLPYDQYPFSRSSLMLLQQCPFLKCTTTAS